VLVLVGRVLNACQKDRQAMASKDGGGERVSDAALAFHDACEFQATNGADTYWLGDT